MPFVNFQKLSLEQITCLSDQWHAANAEFKTLVDDTEGEELSEEAQEALNCVWAIQDQLLGRKESKR